MLIEPAIHHCQARSDMQARGTSKVPQMRVSRRSPRASFSSPLEGHSLRDLASITPGLARKFLFYFILFYFFPGSLVLHF